MSIFGKLGSMLGNVAPAGGVWKTRNIVTTTSAGAEELAKAASREQALTARRVMEESARRAEQARPKGEYELALIALWSLDGDHRDSIDAQTVKHLFERLMGDDEARVELRETVCRLAVAGAMPPVKVVIDPLVNMSGYMRQVLGQAPMATWTTTASGYVLPDR